jgi:hypothetical protein
VEGTEELGGELFKELQFSCCEKLVAEAWGQLENPEQGEIPPLEAVTRQRLMQTQQLGKS